jgi:hypothetical protein
MLAPVSLGRGDGSAQRKAGHLFSPAARRRYLQPGFATIAPSPSALDLSAATMHGAIGSRLGARSSRTDGPLEWGTIAVETCWNVAQGAKAGWGPSSPMGRRWLQL